MPKLAMFITSVFVLSLIKLQWPKNKSLYSITALPVSTERGAFPDEKESGCVLLGGKY